MPKVTCNWKIKHIVEDSTGGAYFCQWNLRYCVLEITNTTESGIDFIRNAKIGDIIKSTLELQT